MGGGQSYIFRAVDTPFEFSGESSLRLAKSVFDAMNFTGKLERIAIEFTLLRGNMSSKDTAFGRDAAPIMAGYFMPIVYAAFGPKIVLWRHTNGLVASLATVIKPLDLGGINTRPEKFIDFAVFEAEQFGRHYGLVVELNYHGDPKDYWIRKYVNGAAEAVAEPASRPKSH